MALVLLFQYLRWHFTQAPQALVEGWLNMLWFGGNYFSVFLLMRTLWAPWRGIVWHRERAFSLGNFLFTLASNIISRSLGMLMRIPLIIAGTLFQLLIIGAGIILLAVWFLLPALIILSFFYGLILLF